MESDKDLDDLRKQIAELKGEGDTSSPESIEEQIKRLKEELGGNDAKNNEKSE